MNDQDVIINNENMVEFNVYYADLKPGVNLIEASAGTGKTFSIAMLVARFILQQGFTIDQLLVVTFTNAAAQELRDRIRSRLVDIKSVLAGKPSSDNALNEWVAGLADSQRAKVLLVDALADIDNAHIFTIHGFCQRILNQYALESGQVFGAELLRNDTPLRQQIAEDYWRLQTYDRSLMQVGLLRNIAKTPYQLLKYVNGIQENSVVLPERVDLDKCLQELEEQIPTIQSVISLIVESIDSVFENEKMMLNKKFIDKFPLIKRQIKHWLDQQESAIPVDAIISLNTQNLYAALNGNRLRGDDRKHQFLSTHDINPNPLDSLSELLAIVNIAFKQGLYEYLKVELDRRLTQTNQLSFDGMIKRLASALNNSSAQVDNYGQLSFEVLNTGHIKQVLQEKFPVAMIDEFQDTDDAQWSIFSSLAGKRSNYLYLIGDPKQAIYRFRGADIYSYLSAQEKAEQKYNLATNWRSQPALVEAVNNLFAVENPFLIEQIDYLPVKAASDNIFLIQRDPFKTDQVIEKLVLWELDKNPYKSDGSWPGKAKEQIRSHVVNEILNLLTDKNKQTLIINQPDTKQGDRPLCPADIAILVRSNPEAAAYQQALADYGLPSVLNSKTSVFDSDQAKEVYHILNAVLRASKMSLMRFALCQPWFGKNGNDLYDLLDQQQQMDDWIISFQLYHEEWQKKGLLAMMQSLMNDQKVVQHLSVYPDVERRLTNINHILELLQEAAIANRLSMVKTLEWLEDALQGRVVVEGQELRLESDENAINIVTIHSSKGLEYPIVFCPDLWAKTKQDTSGVVIFHEDGEQISDLGSDKFDEHKKLMRLEDRAEELRLLYVAVTRAKYRCYLAWADQRSKDKENQSALAYLLKQQTGDNWTQRLNALSNQYPLAFDYQLLAVDQQVESYYQLCDQLPLEQNKQLHRLIRTDWMMSSYSALAYHSVHDDIPELPIDKSQEQEISSAIEVDTDSENEEENTNIMDALPKGAHTGNLVHELLEVTEFSILLNPSNNEQYIKNRTEMIKRFAVDIDIENTPILDQLLQNTVNTALSDDDPDFILANLSESQCLKEMPFYFAVEQLKTIEINRVLGFSESYLPLSQQQMHGQLTGFIDLICEYQGRYYVMDYKTNSLQNYNVQSMTDSMREHNYGLQYWLYSLVLHRYLKQTLTGYDFDEHFGGVRYLFVRGMKPTEPMSGVFQDQPDLSTIEALSQVFS